MATSSRRGSSSSHNTTNLRHHYQQQPPLPPPKILHFPRRPRCSRPASSAAATKIATVVKIVHRHQQQSPPPRPPHEQSTTGAEPCGRLEALFERERPFTSERRARVAEASSSTTSSPGSSPSLSHSPASNGCRRTSAARSAEPEVEKWRFEAEVLRAECNFLKMEREITGKKLDRSRERVDAVLRSAIEAIVSGRRKVDGNQRVDAALEEIQGKLECLRKRVRRSHHKCRSTSRDSHQHAGWGSCTRNFDRKALVLRRRLQEMNVREMMPKSRAGDGGGPGEVEEEEKVCVREVREISSETTTGDRRSRDDKPTTSSSNGGEPDDPTCKSNCKPPDVEALRRKMQLISMGMLERAEEYDSILSSSSCTTVSTVSSSAKQARDDNSKANQGRTFCPQRLVVVQKPAQDECGVVDGADGVRGEQRCSGTCRDVVLRIVEQVRAETEQWAEMQAMLDQVRGEMDDLRRTRDFWERRAAQSDHKLRSVSAQVAELRQRAGAAEQRAAELEDSAARYGDLLRAWGPAASAKPHGPDTGAGSRAVARTSSSPCEMHKRIEKTGLVSRFLDENTAPLPVPANPKRRPPLREIQNSRT